MRIQILMHCLVRSSCTRVHVMVDMIEHVYLVMRHIEHALVYNTLPKLATLSFKKTRVGSDLVLLKVLLEWSCHVRSSSVLRCVLIKEQLLAILYLAEFDEAWDFSFRVIQPILNDLLMAYYSCQPLVWLIAFMVVGILVEDRVLIVEVLYRWVKRGQNWVLVSESGSTWASLLLKKFVLSKVYQI